MKGRLVMGPCESRERTEKLSERRRVCASSAGRECLARGSLRECFGTVVVGRERGIRSADAAQTWPAQFAGGADGVELGALAAAEWWPGWH